MQALLGVFYHSIGGIASGSFYMPYNKVKGDQAVFVGLKDFPFHS